jgi:hypothetical protein
MNALTGLTAASRFLSDFFSAGELGCTMFGYIPDAFQNDLPELPSESANRARSRDVAAVRQDRRDNINLGGGGGDSAGVSSTAGSSRSNSPRPE